MEKVNFVEWQDSYSVGIPVVDEQHKKLIELTNKLYDACLEGHDAATTYFKEVIHETVNYIKFHFSAEENIMANVNYPDIADHKRQHESFIKKVLEDTKKFEAGKPIPYIFVNYLKDWILNHIAVNDKAYSAYILWLKKNGTLKL